MANVYVRSTDGLDADNGSTWALAKATITGADGVDAAGDTIWLSQVHSETTAGNISVAYAGTLASPQRLLCGNDGVEPPTALTTGAIVAFTGVVSTFNLQGNLYCYGVSFRGGTSTDNVTLSTGGQGTVQIYESCNFQLLGTGGCTLKAGAANGAYVKWVNCDVKFSAVGHYIYSVGNFHWQGGSVLSGGTSPTALINASQNATALVTVEDVDLSNCSAGLVLVTAGSVSGVSGPNNGPRVVFRNCKLPASWSGALTTGTLQAGDRFEMYNCDATSTNYRLWIEDYAGSIKNENTIIRTSGANDGTTGLSWKMVSSAAAKQPLLPLRSPEIVQWNDTTGSKTVTVEIVHDSLTALKDDEVWVEVEYLGSASAPLGTHVTDYKANVLATAANQTASVVTWTTTGLTNPNKQALAVTFTANQKGFIHARVMVAKASYTIYADPMITVT